MDTYEIYRQIEELEMELKGIMDFDELDEIAEQLDGLRSQLDEAGEP